jgi:hypothetical protein
MFLFRSKNSNPDHIRWKCNTGRGRNQSRMIINSMSHGHPIPSLSGIRILLSMRFATSRKNPKSTECCPDRPSADPKRSIGSGENGTGIPQPPTTRQWPNTTTGLTRPCGSFQRPGKTTATRQIGDGSTSSMVHLPSRNECFNLIPVPGKSGLTNSSTGDSSSSIRIRTATTY